MEDDIESDSDQDRETSDEIEECDAGDEEVGDPTIVERDEETGVDNVPEGNEQAQGKILSIIVENQI